ncbi:MAG: hypothetical protein FWE76_07175, partial [Symbiobacteriaceae bacterium]|nr:hypothetical protein [Symbiobacteriaceae bacterium]
VPDPGEAIEPAPEYPAITYLTNRIAQMDDILHVYTDFSDGRNNFTQKAWMGSSYSNIPAMDEAAPGYSGVSGIAAELDLSRHSWGGYMFVNGALKPGATQPDADFGAHDAGLDLSGATSLVFYAKGETGKERVEFFMGGLGWQGSIKSAVYADSTRKVTLGYVTLSQEWQRYELDLQGKDLSRIGCGFGWVTNDVNNRGTKKVCFYVDDIHYTFAQAKPGPLFLQSYAAAEMGSDAAIINGFAYLYDNAIAAMALTYAGNHDRAGQIADAIVYGIQHDRYYQDGRLRNAYASGNPRSFPGWFSARSESFARLPGFYDRTDKEWYEDYYAVSTSTGNLAWGILALCEVYTQMPQRQEYLDAACTLGDLILSLSEEGGFPGGFEGWEGSEIKVSYLSTEHNIDLITAFDYLAELSEDERYATGAVRAREFVLSMYDADRHCFYTGTTEDGVTINKEVLPLDCQTWAILALGESFAHGEQVMEFVEEHLGIDGGYDFNTDKDGIWFEGTAQVALAYLTLGNRDKYETIMALLAENVLPDGSIPAADRDDVTTGFMVSGTDIPWTYPNRSHLGATAWLAFAQMERNPLAPR